MSGILTVYRWELRKLAAQLRTRAILGACLVAPFVFAIALGFQDRLPKDQVFGRFLHASGFATPLLILGFAGLWAFPLLTAIVAGDIFASEDHYGTLKTILTRSRSRAQVFTGKVAAALTFGIVTVLLLGVSSTLAGLLLVGHQPLVGLSGQLMSSGTALRLVAESWTIVLLPMVGFTAVAIMLSVLTRNSAIGVVGPVVIGLLMQMYSFLNGADPVRHLMLVNPFTAWHGLAMTPIDATPIWQGALVSLAYTTGALAIAYRSFSRRDVAGG
jgi:ABC-2 type transport system permease protein